MSYVLVIFMAFHTLNSPASQKIEFSSHAACVKAKNKVIDEVKSTRTRSGTKAVVAICIKR